LGDKRQHRPIVTRVHAPRQAAATKQAKADREADAARATLGLRKQSKATARKIEGKMLVMDAVRGLAQAIWDSQQDYRRMLQQRVLDGHRPYDRNLEDPSEFEQFSAL
jgi:hypothetical protein